MSEDKPKADRLRECIAVLQKLTKEFGIPYESPEIQELKSRFDPYIADGTPWNGTVSFKVYGRVAHVNLPKRARSSVEVVLKSWRK